jgi:hypothetical protein
MKKLLIVFTLIFPLISSAQKQGNIWYFGNHAGLDFNSGSPITLPNGQTYSPDGTNIEGTAVICDSSGALLFYTNGQKIWNKNQQVMPHGDSLLGNFSSTQSALIIPQPGSSRYYYVFTTDAFWIDNLQFGFRFSIVDICLDNGLGDVIINKVNIKLLDTVAEKLTAVRHANGIDYWVIVHKYYSDAFYAYRLSSTGITDTVISHVGSVHPSVNQAMPAAIGQLKASPNGQKLAIVNGNSNNSIAEYFDFNAGTGVVSNCVNIQTNPLYNYYGVSFSPDNSKLYITCWLNNNGVYQFNLNAGLGNPDSVKASKIKINNGTNIAIQLGPDGKIYLGGGFSSMYLSVINNPNNSGLNCNFDDSTIFLFGTCNQGLPNFIDSYDYLNATFICPDTLESINEVANIVNTRIFPNPANQTLTIESPQPSTITLLNLQGQQIKTLATTGTTTLDISNLARGMYFLEVKTEKGVAVRKFIKE